MGKTKHKKHHRHEDGDGEEAGDDASNPGLKMVLIKTSKNTLREELFHFQNLSEIHRNKFK